MKFLYLSLYLFICLLGSSAFSQQVAINDSFTPQQLIENNLIQGCVETSNITSQINGSVNGFKSYAYFEKGNSNFPFENGIMLSTGKAISGGNGQSNAVLNEGQTNWLTDPDLETALGISNTLNATSIEFDFISSSNQIQFNYILASEEYFGEFPCNYSDGFAFLIKQAGTDDPFTNIAIIPGTSTPVNTNTIHDAIVGFCPASNAQYFEGYNMGATNYNGRTKILSATASINPNITYHIKMIIADQTDKNYDSAVFIEGNSFNATVDLGDDVTTCAGSLTLDGNIGNPQATYSWYFNTNLITGASQPTLNIEQSGTYTIKVQIPLAGSICEIEDTIEVSLNSTQTTMPISDFQLCDDPSMNGIEIFDLNTMNDEILASLPEGSYSISYHSSSANALNNINPITTPIQNTTNNQIIFIRINDMVNGCLAYNSFHLVVNASPVITPPTALIICDDAVADGITQIDFTQSNNDITNGNSDLIVTFHDSQNNANLGLSSLQIPYTNSNPVGSVFVRVENPITGCYATTILSYTVINAPNINYEDIFIDACDGDYDGMATFDLNDAIADTLEGLTGVTVTFHETYEDAESGSNSIPNPANYNNTTPFEQIIYIRVEDDITGCTSVRSFEIHSNLLLTGTDIHDFTMCDAENDNSENFNLNVIAQDIINGLEDVTVTFYTSEADQTNQINALNPSVPFTPSAPPTILYITINSPTCSEISQIELFLVPIVSFTSVGPVDYCDDDTDGFTSIDLHSFDNLMTGNLSGFNVVYYASQEDADNNENPLPNFYTNTANPTIIYPKVSSVETGCGDVNAFQINVFPAPVTTNPDNLIICDDNQDGYTVVDLTQFYNQLVPDTNNRSFSFFLTENDLFNNINALINLTNYNTNSIVVHTKVTNTLTGCWSKAKFNIYVNTLPIFTAINNYKSCEEASDGFSEFLFSTKDAEILNGQIGKKVLYFESQSDADNRINKINKNALYSNISNPQTIFVRVENLTDQNCYGTSSFNIETGTNPLFNEPTDWFVCDDISSDAIAVFDLTTKITEITQGINDNLEVTFHTTFANAQVGTNPVATQFANTVNPQQIYARVDNGTICASVVSFTLNVIQVAQANPSQPLNMCDTNYDGHVTFDLTLSEIDILDVRQDNIVISYFGTLANLDANTNAINNPTSYNNLTNPQTVFVRLTNTVSDCYLAIPLELNVNLPPAINQFGNIIVCENQNNYFDLLEANVLLVDDQTNTIITYHTIPGDALSDSNPMNTDLTYTTDNTMIHARVENATTGCFITHTFNLVVKPLPTAMTPNDLEACDDDFDGLLEFDLSSQNATTLGGQNPANFTVSYFNTLADAQSGSNIIPELYMAFNTEIIYVRVQNNTTGCFSTTLFSIIIHPRPVVDILDQVVCLDNLPLLVSANTNNPTDTYVWSTGETTSEIEISTMNTYSVTVTSDFGCITTQVFNVTESEQANIEIVETVDFSDPNNITITISGIGNYLYQLDDNAPQDSNVFQNVGIGYHTITVIDLNGCDEVSKEVLVLDFPLFFTPNDDAYFDTWHIIGVETIPETVIYIYDRYGKQLTYLTANSAGWDGTYNGNNMPATDYWFVAHVKGGDYDFQAKGHFALRR